MVTVSFHQIYRKNRFKSIALPPLVTIFFFFWFFFFCFYHTWLNIRLVNLSGDVEKNPGLKSYSEQYLAICDWNLNSIATHNFIKVALLKSKTYLDSSASTDDDNLQIPGYRADHPST